MKCFNHPDAEAVGVCKNCYKGVCPTCAALVDGSVACAATCRDDVAAINHMLERGKKVYKNLGRQWGPSVLLNGVGGVLFLGFGLYNLGPPMSWLLVGLGGIMLAASVMSARMARRMGERDDTGAP